MSLKIKNYSFKILELDRDILKNVDLEIKNGEIVVLVGENGTGKSSFAMSLLGISEYERSGSVKVNDEETIDMEIDEIARAGLFISFQSPPEIEGVSLYQFITSGFKALNPNSNLSSFKLRKKILEKANLVGLNESFLERSTNQGFSGGERRKSEVLQLLVLEPKVAVLDEVDSGLDIKSTHNISKILNNYVKETGNSLLIISHSIEFIKKINPTRIIELKDKSFSETQISELDEIIDEDQKKDI